MKKALFAIGVLAALSTAAYAAEPRKQRDAIAIPNPILFVGQVPVPDDFTTVASTFGNHKGDVTSAPRGGDLFILYPTGTLKNVTRTAGYGNTGFQGANSIAVREPSVHWSGTKALFSMVVGSATAQYQVKTFKWQIYEVTNLAENQTPVITKVANQPDFNNISPVYGTDDRIIFTSDRPRDGSAHLYPQLDEYEEAATVTGIWSLNPVNGDLRLLNHTPSGAFTPSIDSYGRLIFTRWDHLQRDQQADADADTPGSYGTFDFSNESSGATKLNQRVEVFPEPRNGNTPPGSNLAGNNINHFFPWMINEDGTSEETLNHIGRHELHNYFNLSLTDDPALTEFIYVNGIRTNTNRLDNAFQLREDPANAGVYFAVDCPEFRTHASGQIVKFSAPPTQHADGIQVTYLTPRATASYQDQPTGDHTGHYRDPLPLSSGSLIASHTAEYRDDVNTGTRPAPASRYDFKLKFLSLQQDGYFTPGTSITGGIQASVSWWDPDVSVQWSGALWEISPVEIKARPVPAMLTTPLEQPELNCFVTASVDPNDLKQYLAENDLALMVVRDVTTRDKADKQQPFNLRVPNGVSHVVNNTQKIYDVTRVALYQADQVRGIGGTPDPSNNTLMTGGRAGRRVLARDMHDTAAMAANNPATVNASGSAQLSTDGSMAAFVPARRAMSWELTDPNDTGVVRERYWITFQPGEVRVCGSCHGANTKTQMNQDPPTNTPAALTALLQFWKTQRAAVPAKPSNVSATATTGTSVQVSWSASPGATTYEVARASATSGYVIVGTTASTSLNDTVASGQAYVYKVRAVGASGRSNYSTPDIATTFFFSDDPLVAQSTFIKAAHVSELRQAINALRTTAGLTSTSFTDPSVATGGSIKAVHFTEMRNALNQARAPLGVGTVTFTDATLNAGATSVRAAHVTDLRNGVK